MSQTQYVWPIDTTWKRCFMKVYDSQRTWISTNDPTTTSPFFSLLWEGQIQKSEVQPTVKCEAKSNGSLGTPKGIHRSDWINIAMNAVVLCSYIILMKSLPSFGKARRTNFIKLIQHPPSCSSQGGNAGAWPPSDPWVSMLSLCEKGNSTRPVPSWIAIGWCV